MAESSESIKEQVFRSVASADFPEGTEKSKCLSVLQNFAPICADPLNPSVYPCFVKETRMVFFFSATILLKYIPINFLITNICVL